MNKLYYTTDLKYQEEGYKDIYLYLIKDNQPLLIEEMSLDIDDVAESEIKMYLKFRPFEDIDSEDYSEELTELLKGYTEENTKLEQL